MLKNREIWGIEAYSLRDGHDFNFVPITALEQAIFRPLKTYLQVAFNRFNYPDKVNVEAAMVNVEGINRLVPGTYLETYGRPL